MRNESRRDSGEARAISGVEGDELALLRLEVHEVPEPLAERPFHLLDGPEYAAADGPDLLVDGGGNELGRGKDRRRAPRT